MAGDAVGGCFGNCDAGEGEQQRHVGPGEFELEVGPLEGEWVLDGAGEGDAGWAVGDVEIDGVGLGSVLQGQEGAADELGSDGLGGVGAAGVGGDLTGAGLVVLGGDGDVEVGAELGVADMDVAVVDMQRADRGTRRGVGVRRGGLVAAECPVRAAVGDLLCVDVGRVDGDVEDHDGAVLDVVERLDGDGEGVGGGEGAATGPVFRVVDGDAVGLDAGDAAERDVEVGDGDGAAEGGGGLAVDDGDEPIPLEEQGGDDDEGEDDA